MSNCLINLNKLLNNRGKYLIIQKCLYASQPVYNQWEPYPYTTELFRKNYIRYKAQSASEVSHDYVYHGTERLPTLEERLKEFKDPLDQRSTINIGKQIKQYEEEANAKIAAKEKFKANKSDKILEINARDLKIEVPFDEIDKDWNDYCKYKEIKAVAEHYNIFKDLYDAGYFYSTINFNVSYENKAKKGESNVTNVQYGNKIDAKHVVGKPKLDLSKLEDKKYYTLTFMNLDGNLQDNSKEVLLWFISNITKDNLNGDELFTYLQPFPMKGTGWHRCVYVLYEHDNKIDYNSGFFKQRIDKNGEFDLKKRDFKTLDFYANHQKEITPVSYLFFQTQHDLSVKNTFHNVLNMKEPIYEYAFEKKFIPRQEKYPIQMPFNWYLQEYQDIKDVNEEILKGYLKKLSPFEDYPEPLEYPLIENENYKLPRWYRLEMQDYKYRRYRYKLIPFKYSAAVLEKQKCLKSLPYQVQEQFK